MVTAEYAVIFEICACRGGRTVTDSVNYF